MERSANTSRRGTRPGLTNVNLSVLHNGGLRAFARARGNRLAHAGCGVPVPSRATWRRVAGGLTVVTAAAWAVCAGAATAAPAVPMCDGQRATIVGMAKADRLIGTPRRDVIVAGAGHDVVHGRGGGDVICAGPGNDTVDG